MTSMNQMVRKRGERAFFFCPRKRLNTLYIQSKYIVLRTCGNGILRKVYAAVHGERGEVKKRKIKKFNGQKRSKIAKSEYSAVVRPQILN